MRTIIRNSALLLVAAAMAVSLGGDGLAGERNREPMKTRQGGKFNVSGRYTGMLQGAIEVGGRSVQVTKDTKVYVTGKGFVDSPMLYGDAVYVMGARSGGESRATMIIVRPLQRNATRGGGDRTGKLPADAAL
jgi:hypothetical protein